MKKEFYNGMVRVTKPTALRHYLKGEMVYLFPDKANPNSPWILPVMMQLESKNCSLLELSDKVIVRHVKEESKERFNKIVNEFEFYNCNDYELGEYAKFFVMEG